MANETARTTMRRLADCTEIAAFLGLKGHNQRFYCPDCRARGHAEPEMEATADRFFCSRCRKEGDALALVRTTLACDEPTAMDWINGALGLGELSPPGTSPRVRIPQKPAPAPAAATKTPSPTRRVKIYSAFLEACRPPVGAALNFLTARGVSQAAIETVGVRFCGAEYGDRLKDLARFFKMSALKATGLLNFDGYVKKVGGFLVFPYVHQGIPVLLRARPPVDPDHLAGLQLPAAISSGRRLLCLFNHEALHESREILLCRGEVETLIAVTHGQAAVGLPGWQYFKPRWLTALQGKKVSILVQESQSKEETLQELIGKLTKAGITSLSLMTVPTGMSLDAFFLQQPAP